MCLQLVNATFLKSTSCNLQVYTDDSFPDTEFILPSHLVVKVLPNACEQIALQVPEVSRGTQQGKPSRFALKNDAPALCHFSQVDYLGCGSSGYTILALDKACGDRVAIKVLQRTSSVSLANAIIE